MKSPRPRTRAASPDSTSLVWGAALAALAILAAVPGASAQDFTIDPGFTRVLTTIRPRATTPGTPVETVRLTTTDEGAIEYLGAPPEHDFFDRDTTIRDPETAARRFTTQHRELFGIRSTAVDFTTTSVRTRRTGTIVRLSQTYAGIPVFAGELRVQVNLELGVDAVLADLGRRWTELDSGRLSTRPTLTAEDAIRAAQNLIRRELLLTPFTVGKPVLHIYDPAILDLPGPVRLAWRLDAVSEDSFTLDDDLLLDAHDGSLLNRITRIHSALDREIYDAANARSDPGTLVRDEGDPASGIAAADAAYALFSDIYNFYKNNHDRDSYNDSGSTLEATVRYCNTNFPAGGCAFLPQNAMWSSGKKRMYFGPNTVVDDVAGHEVTHGVTQDESGLLYQNASGAINESFSDIWGEFIDLTNGTGDDSSAVRWLLGEDWVSGGIRDLRDPTNSSQPDRLGSSLYVPATNSPAGSNDFGGVHVNSGVNNKLCYLLTDGDTFNGQTIVGMGIARVADLYYEAQTSLLTSSSGWTALYNALQQSAINLGWSIAERNNLFRACLAVEIAAPRSFWVQHGVACAAFPNGAKNCTPIVPFFQPTGGTPFPTITMANGAAFPGDVLRIVTDNYFESLTFSKRLKLVPEGGPVIIGLP